MYEGLWSKWTYCEGQMERNGELYITPQKVRELGTRYAIWNFTAEGEMSERFDKRMMNFSLAPPNPHYQAAEANASFLSHGFTIIFTADTCFKTRKDLFTSLSLSFARSLTHSLTYTHLRSLSTSLSFSQSLIHKLLLFLEEAGIIWIILRFLGGRRNGVCFTLVKG